MFSSHIHRIIDIAAVCSVAGAIPTNSSAFGPGAGLIALSNLRCIGSELMLRSCLSGVVTACGHEEDVGVRCQLRSG